ncbi:MAG: type II toxin-antitoxin system VapC family toxin [Acidimicrobiales bacterium]
MILVDTSIWIEHLRNGNATLRRLLERGAVFAHPWVVGELSLGNLSRRAEVLGLLRGLPRATVVTPDEVLGVVEHYQLIGLGIGYVDVQLLAAAKVTAGTALWTGDKRLAAAASRRWEPRGLLGRAC